MSKRKVWMVVWDINAEKGGINSVMYRRTKLFNNERYASDLLTLDDKRFGYAEIEKTLHEDGRLHPDARIINVYDYYREKMTVHAQISEENRAHYERLNELEEDGFMMIQKDDQTLYFQHGRLQKEKFWDANGHLEHISYYSATRVISSTEYFHPDGYLMCKHTFHPATGNVSQIFHYTREGHCYLVRWFEPETGRQLHVVLFESTSKKAIPFRNNNGFHTYFLEELARQETERPFLICDGPSSNFKVQQMEAGLAHRIYPVHTTTYEEPYTRGSEMKKNHQQIFDNPDDQAPIVLLTERQREDLRVDYPTKRYEVISNAVEIPQQIGKKKPFVASIVSRLEDLKRIELAIEAFKFVVRDEPEATLYIYGSGDAEAALKKRVKRLKLTQHIFFKGYTTEADRVFAESQFTLITSLFEGQSLVALEAFANKTTVISFDIDYLVEEMYEDETLCTLVPNGDIEALAEAMLDLFKHPEKAAAMGEVGHQLVREKYTFEKQYDKWQALFDELDAQA